MRSAFEVYDPRLFLGSIRININFLIWRFFFFFFFPFQLYGEKSKGILSFFNLFFLGVKQYCREFDGRSLRGLKVLLSRIFLTLGIANMVGLLPYTYRVRSHLFWTASLGFPVWLLYLIKIYRENPVRGVSFFLPRFCSVEKKPKYGLMLVLRLLEVVRLFIQPLTLSIRLIANVGAGHLALRLARSLLILLSGIRSFLVFLVLIFYFCFELAVNLVQAYIFFLLLLRYRPSNITLKTIKMK